MTRWVKKYNVIFIHDFSRYIKLYLLKSKDEAYKKFLLYIGEVKTQLNKKKSNELDLIEKVSMFLWITIMKKKV